MNSRIATVQTVISDFRITGVCPVDRNVPNETYFVVPEDINQNTLQDTNPTLNSSIKLLAHPQKELEA